MDLWILVPTLVLVAVGIAMVFSASIPMSAVKQSDDIYYYLKREIAFGLLGGFGLFLAARVSMKKLERQAGFLFFLALALLALVLVIGVRINGAKSWLGVPGTPIRFQPSELAKILLVIATARYFAKFPMGLPNWRRAAPPLVMLALVGGLIAVEPDMGTAAVLGLSMLVYFHLAGAKMSHLAGAGALSLPFLGVMLWKHPYQLDRFIGFVKTDELALTQGYQAKQCLIALGSGGLLGHGYCGSVWKYSYLPAAINDSILPVIGEELGMIATWTIVALFAILVCRGLTIAGQARDRFSGLVAAGVTCLIGIQALLNIAVATHCVPATGVPLPFVSYGGSSLVFSLVGVGLLLNVARHRLTEEDLPASAEIA